MVIFPKFQIGMVPNKLHFFNPTIWGSEMHPDPSFSGTKSYGVYFYLIFQKLIINQEKSYFFNQSDQTWSCNSNFSILPPPLQLQQGKPYSYTHFQNHASNKNTAGWCKISTCCTRIVSILLCRSGHDLLLKSFNVDLGLLLIMAIKVI